MKKMIIASYFMGMLLLTYFTAKAVSTYRTGSIEVKFIEHERDLNDTEVSQRGIVPQEDKKVVEKWKTKETRTKSWLGWETRIDTVVNPQTYYVDCGCK